MLPNRLRDEIAAWLEFYQELGIEEFLIEPRELGAEAQLPPTGSRPLSTDLETTADPSMKNRQSSIVNEPAPAPELASGPAIVNRPSSIGNQPNSDSRFLTPTAPARSLNLFEAEAPRKSERESLEDIRADLGDCRRCKLAGGRKNIVFGQGDPHAQLVFVGEGPGADEDEQGLPFVGRAGQLLNRMLQFVSIRREDVYICNVVKCRPPGNRTPERDEVEACSPFLYRQIEAIRPRLVCCLGAPAVKTVLGLKEGILKLRGRFYDFAGTKALATVHPAYVLRNPREEKILREDFEKIRDFLRQPATPPR
jgi:uracil-DNA glycosylase family 4